MSNNYVPGMSEDPYTKTPYPKSGYEMAGIYRAYVEDDEDPLKVGRVRIRIPLMHGVPTSSKTNRNAPASSSVAKNRTRTSNSTKKKSSTIPTEGLPWAPVSYMGAGPDQGQYITPEVGTVVFVAFEGGNPDLPVVLGGNYGTGKQSSDNLGYVKDLYNNDENSKTSKKKSFVASNGRYYQSSERTESPDDYDRDPVDKIIYKSPKGATISINEEDGAEELSIIDHNGQVIKMFSPYTEEANEYNAGKRGKARADKGTASSIDEVTNGKYDENTKFGIELYTTNGGSVRLTSTADGKNHILLDAEDIVTTSELKIGTSKIRSQKDWELDGNTSQGGSDGSSSTDADYPFEDEDSIDDEIGVSHDGINPDVEGNVDDTSQVDSETNWRDGEEPNND